MEGEKQVSPESLGDKTLPQLRELLDRQEKLASNQKLLSKLPDKGHKVLQFLETLRHVVDERQRLEASVSRQPAGSASMAVPQHSTHLTATESKPPVTLTTEGSSQGHSVISQEQAVDTVGDGEMADTTTDISQCLESLTVSELAAPRMSSGEKVTVAPGDGGNLETRFPNSYETVMKRNEESARKKSPFKPHSSLKIAQVEDLPEAYKLKSKNPAPDTVAGEKAVETTTNVKEERPPEESAVVGPAYRFAGAKQITIQDSISLQKQQHEQLEKLKSIHAAEKLAERLNIKTAVYNPTAVDMDYRTAEAADDADAYDSDDVPDDEVLS